MSGRLEIRQCTLREIAETGDFYDRVTYELEHHINYPKWSYKIYPSTAAVREAATSGTQYIAREDGRLAGAFVLNDNPGGLYERGQWSRALPRGEYAVLHMLAAAPELQGCGVGRAMVQWALEQSAALGYRALRLDVVPTNTPGIRLYESMGFTCAGEVDLGREGAGIPRFRLYERNF